MTVEIVCPLYKAQEYIKHLHDSFLNQQGKFKLKIHYIVTKSDDYTEQILDDLNAFYEVIDACEFSHSLTREKAAMASNADIIVFVTQDVIIKQVDWLENLINSMGKDNIAAAYSRQLCTNNSIEKYTRERNYPENSFVVSKEDINEFGLRTFFFSDASGAIDLNVFKKLNGYDGKKLPISEDMYFAYKLIMNGYKIKYCADSVVEHSHKFSFKELYKRYYDTGKFFKQNPYLNNYGTTDSGMCMAFYILGNAIKEFNIGVLVEFLPNMLARYFGMWRGCKYDE